MKKQHLGFIALGVVIGIAAFIGLTAKNAAGEYAYICTNGTEFSITPSSDVSSLTVYPGKNARVFSDTKLPKVTSNTGALYVGGGVVLFGKGETLQLITASSSVACKPVVNKDSAPLNWGD